MSAKLKGVSCGWRRCIVVLGFDVEDDDEGEDKSGVHSRLHHNIVFVISREYTE